MLLPFDARGVGRCRDKTPLYIDAALSSGGMCDGGRRAAKGIANLRKARLVKPAVPDSASYCPAVGIKFARSHVVMAALVVKDEKTNQFRLSSNKHRVDD
jgi:hypothetical protein